MVTSFADLTTSALPIAYFFDDGWIHVKITETNDRRVGGFFVDQTGSGYGIADSEGIV